jgi:transcription elongation factor GreA
MPEEQLYVTQEGLEKLKTELNELVTDRRPAAVEQIKRARELGDLSENSLYDQARAEQSFVEGRIQELESILERAKVVESAGGDKVSLGSKVVVHIDGDEESFTIVGEPEADPSDAKISHTSPLGQALMGKKVGDEVAVEAPVGEIIYRIMKVE